SRDALGRHVLARRRSARIERIDARAMKTSRSLRMGQSELNLFGRLRPRFGRVAEVNWLESGTADYAKGRPFKALQAWERASAIGWVEADYRIGLLYLRGNGVARSVPDAVAWFQRAGDLGYPEAQYQLGCIYLNGSKGNTNGSEEWFRLASQHD